MTFLPKVTLAILVAAAIAGASGKLLEVLQSFASRAQLHGLNRNVFHESSEYNNWSAFVKTSDAGSQCRCGRVDRGMQPPASPQPHPKLPLPQTHNNNVFFVFSTRA